MKRLTAKTITKKKSAQFQQPRLYGIGGGIDTEINVIEKRTQKQTHRKYAQMTKDQKKFSGGKISFSTNGAGAIGHTWRAGRWGQKKNLDLREY